VLGETAMAVMNKERSILHGQLLADIADGSAEEVYEETREQLEGHKTYRQLARRGIFEPKEVELKVEYLVMYESLTKGLGWWKRAKRRYALLKEYK
jgi:hypothetical protein